MYERNSSLKGYYAVNKFVSLNREFYIFTTRFGFMEMPLKRKQYLFKRNPKQTLVQSLLVGAICSAWLMAGSALAQAKEGVVCNVNDFKMLALATNDEQAREKVVSDWLNKSGKVCAADQIIYLRTNLASWLGTANTLKINQTIENLFNEKKAAEKNYNANTSELEKNNNNPPTNKPSGETVSTRK